MRYLIILLFIAGGINYDEIQIMGKITKKDKTQNFGQSKPKDSKLIKSLKTKGYKDKDGHHKQYKDPN